MPGQSTLRKRLPPSSWSASSTANRMSTNTSEHDEQLCTQSKHPSFKKPGCQWTLFLPILLYRPRLGNPCAEVQTRQTDPALSLFGQSRTSIISPLQRRRLPSANQQDTTEYCVQFRMSTILRTLRNLRRVGIKVGCYSETGVTVMQRKLCANRLPSMNRMLPTRCRYEPRILYNVLGGKLGYCWFKGIELLTLFP